MRIPVLMLSILLTTSTLSAQQITLRLPQRNHPQRRVNLGNSYYRLIAVVPLTGSSSSKADPRRPAFAPVPVAGVPRSGIIGFTYLLSDDKNKELVEYVATDPAAFAPILADRSITAFEKVDLFNLLTPEQKEKAKAFFHRGGFVPGRDGRGMMGPDHGSGPGPGMMGPDHRMGPGSGMMGPCDGSACN